MIQRSTSASFPQPKKRFGQHFLHDPFVIDQIIASVDPRQEQHVVEIGPGTGALTAKLIKHVGLLTVIELDRDLAANLEARVGTYENLHIHARDALKIGLSDLVQDREKLRLVGNLPYNIATPLVFHYLDQLAVISDMTFMVQREVAERMVATASTSSYGRLSVMLQHQCKVEKLLDVGPGAFRPPPQVHSTVVRILPLQHPLPLLSKESFVRIVRGAFVQRRKTLRNALCHLVSRETFAVADIDSSRRAETMSVAEFVRLANTATLEMAAEGQRK